MFKNKERQEIYALQSAPKTNQFQIWPFLIFPENFITPEILWPGVCLQTNRGENNTLSNFIVKNQKKKFDGQR